MGDVDSTVSSDGGGGLVRSTSVYVGAIEITPVVDGVGSADPASFFVGSTDSGWELHRKYLDHGRWNFPVGGHLVRTRQATVLVDAGFGPYATKSTNGGRLLESLRHLGVHPDDITDVMLTHLHPDHIGWVSSDGSPTFRNATYRCHDRDWGYFTGGGGRSMLQGPAVRNPDCDSYDGRSWLDILQAIEGQLETWSSDGAVLRSLDVLEVPGHTPGSSVVVISDEGSRAMIVGDAVHCPAQFTELEWAAYADVDPSAAAIARRRLAIEVERSGDLIAGPHFPGMQFGRVLPAERGRTWQIAR